MAAYAGATVQGFTDYHTERGRDLPGTLDDEAIQASLLVASEWIDNIYGSSFVGEKTGGYLQEREWPRVNAIVYDSKGRNSYTYPAAAIPERLINAVYEAAYRQVLTPGALMVDYTPGKYKSVSIDGAVSVDYAQFSFAAQVQASFPIIDNLLLPLFDLRASVQFSSYSGGTSRV